MGGIRVVCTIIAKNYLASARVLMESVKRYHPEAQRVALLVDTLEGYPAQDEPFDIVLAEDLNIPKWPHFAMKYDVMELSTAVKPYLLAWLFDHYHADKVIYFDPDIQLYHPLDALFDLLDEHMAVLTPHILASLADDKQPSDLTFLRTGTYNLGFLALSKRGDVDRLLTWWQGKLYDQCLNDIEQGLFVDQHWADLFPSLFGGVHVLRHPGYNVAYWNFKGRDLGATDAGYTVNGEPLVFFHFSGLPFDDVESVSRHQNRYTLADLNPHFRTIITGYRAAVEAAGYPATSRLPYAYGWFEDNVPVSIVLRRCLRQHDPDGQRWENPFDIRSADSFRAWATRVPAGRSRLSPYALTLYKMSDYLIKVFPNVPGADEAGYIAWLKQQEGTAEVFHSGYLHPLKRAAARDAADKRPRASQRSPAKARNRVARTWTYYRNFPTTVAPFLPKNALDIQPALYSGPGGVYGAVRAFLYRMGLLQRVRRLVGLRTIMTARLFFSPDFHAAGAFGTTPARIAPGPNRHGQLGALPAAALQEGVNVAGYLYAESGIGELARSVLRSLRAVNFPVATQPIKDYDPARQGERLAHQFPQGTPYPITIFHVNADMTYPVFDILGTDHYDNHYNIGYWAWELAEFPDAWQTCFDPYDEIWVFSSFAQAAIAAKTPIPVVKMPVAIAPTLPPDATRASLGLPDDAFLALYVFDAFSVIERKNPHAVVRAFEQAFTPAEREKKARLVIKANNLYRFPKAAAALRRAVEQVNGILIETYLERDQVNTLIAQCDVYLSLHRAEGYGLTLAEAMYFGKPVIATGYSGNTDFMTINNSYLVPYRLVTLEQEYPPYPAGSEWAEPDVTAAADMLRRVYDRPEEARQKGQIAAQDIRRDHSHATVGNAIANRLRYILQQAQE